MTYLEQIKQAVRSEYSSDSDFYQDYIKQWKAEFESLVKESFPGEDLTWKMFYLIFLGKAFPLDSALQLSPEDALIELVQRSAEIDKQIRTNEELNGPSIMGKYYDI